jgi:hypothetical protein
MYSMFFPDASGATEQEQTEHWSSEQHLCQAVAGSQCRRWALRQQLHTEVPQLHSPTFNSRPPNIIKKMISTHLRQAVAGA